MSDYPKFEGEKLKLGDKEYVIPPLTWRRIRELLPVLGRIKISPVGLEITGEMLDDYATVILAALNRNYPDMTRESLEDVLDLGNAPQIFLAIMGMSGLIRGEMMPGMASPSIGGDSILP